MDNSESNKDEKKLDNRKIREIIQFQIMALITQGKYEEASRNMKVFFNKVKKDMGEEEYKSRVSRTILTIRDYFIRNAKDIPSEFQDFFIDMAEMYIESGSYEAAEDIIKVAIDIKRDIHKIKNATNKTEKKNILGEELLKICALRINDEPQNVTDIIDDLTNLDEEKKKDLGFSGFTRDQFAYSMFLKVTEQISVEDVMNSIIRTSEGKGVRKPRQNNTPVYSTPNSKTELPIYLLPENRLKFFIESFPNATLRVNKNNGFSDYICIDVNDCDFVILEKFFTKGADGQQRISVDRDATFIVPKGLVTECLCKSNIRKEAVKSKKIQIVNHTKRTDMPEQEIEKYFSNEEVRTENKEIPYDRINYYRNFMSKFNTAVGENYFKKVGLQKNILPPNPSKNAKIKLKGPKRVMDEKRIMELMDELEVLKELIEEEKSYNERLEEYNKRLHEIIVELDEYLGIEEGLD